MQFNDATRAAIIALIQSVFPVLILLGVVSLTTDQVAALMLVVTNVLTLSALVFKSGQGT